jgi:YD repeat-containing protein
LLLEVAGVGSNAKTNSYSYDDNGVLIQESHADGSWAMYQYDTQGRCTAKFSPFLNSQPSTNSTTGKMETYSYDPNMVFDQHQPVNDDGSILPNTPRCTINFIQGQEVSRQYTALLPIERIDVQCINPGDSFTTPGNLKTYTWYSTDVNHYGEVSKIIHP